DTLSLHDALPIWAFKGEVDGVADFDLGVRGCQLQLICRLITFAVHDGQVCGGFAMLRVLCCQAILAGFQFVGQFNDGAQIAVVVGIGGTESLAGLTQLYLSLCQPCFGVVVIIATVGASWINGDLGLGGGICGGHGAGGAEPDVSLYQRGGCEPSGKRVACTEANFVHHAGALLTLSIVFHIIDSCAMSWIWLLVSNEV